MFVIYHIWDKDKNPIWISYQDAPRWGRGWSQSSGCILYNATPIPFEEIPVQIALGVIPDPRKAFFGFATMAMDGKHDENKKYSLVKVWCANDPSICV